MTAAQTGLFFDRIEKAFGGTRALRGVSLRIGRGEVVALLGENGAGKSTLIKILGGVHRPDQGGVFIDGAAYAHVAGRRGGQKVAFIHQDLGLIEWMSVAENIALSLGYVRRAGRIDWTATEAAADRALAMVDADFPATARVDSLTRTQKSLVAIARALASDCEFLVLDEPTASLPADEVERLFDALRPLRAKGVGMIYVSHRLDEIFRIADRVAVLRDGQMVGMRDVQHTTPDELVSLIVGRKAREIDRPPVMEGPAILTVRGLRSRSVGPVDFDIRRGELLGLAGLRGAGHEDIGRALFGALPFAGEVRLDGAIPNLADPRRAMQSGVGLVARDRVAESVAVGMSIRENAYLNPAATGRGLLQPRSARREGALAQAMGRRVGLNPNDPTLPIEALSGGNQQKVVVGRWLDSGRRLLITEDPTAGVDVGAKAEIYHLLYQALESGMGVLVVSTDFEEIAAICHRAIVFSRGLPVAELTGAQLST
ncbi:MAG: sugar ABC transporter ATP-binding protein, partial [Rhodobacteraceae bacterium]|nr:sugar ABC transporter ATP-binding protein [Paracoccaceae bacterium]